MLHTSYQKNKGSPESEMIRQMFEDASRSWTTDQLKEFFLTWLFETEQKNILETATLEELRILFGQVRDYICE